MRFPFATIYQSFARKNGGIWASRADIIWYGMLLLAGVFALLLAADGYLFYVSHLRERVSTPLPPRSVTLSENEIDEALRLIDDRGQKLKALLGEEK